MSWDKKIPYTTLKHQFVSYFNITLSEFIRKPRKRRGQALVYTATALIQLTNGMRAGEAMLSLRKYIEDNEEEFTIYSFKQSIKKKLKDGRVVEKNLSEFEQRIVRIPKLVIANRYHIEKAINLGWGHPDKFMTIKFLDPRERIKNEREYKRYANKYEVWMQRNFSINTHTLRYAWQNEILNYINEVEIIAKIQGRKNLNVLLEYIRSEKAREKYEKVFRYLEA